MGKSWAAPRAVPRAGWTVSPREWRSAWNWAAWRDRHWADKTEERRAGSMAVMMAD